MPPPENDADAFKMGERIRAWIKNGRPKPDETTIPDVDVDKHDEEEKHDKEEKPEKKGGRFGFFKK